MERDRATERDTRTDDARDEEDTTTDREELELELMDADASDEGERIGDDTS